MYNLKGDKMEQVNDILEQRGSRYGDFKTHADITQTLKAVKNLYVKSLNKGLNPSQHESLDMIFHKIGRIINGDPNYVDSWVDIAGYAQLVVNQLEGKKDNGESERSHRGKTSLKSTIKRGTGKLGSNLRKKNKGTKTLNTGYGPGFTGGQIF